MKDTLISVTAPGHGIYRAYDTDVRDILARYSGRLEMLTDANEIGSPADFSDLSTTSLAIVLASFTPGSSAL